MHHREQVALERGSDHPRVVFRILDIHQRLAAHRRVAGVERMHPSLGGSAPLLGRFARPAHSGAVSERVEESSAGELQVQAPGFGDPHGDGHIPEATDQQIRHDHDRGDRQPHRGRSGRARDGLVGEVQNAHGPV